MASVSVAGEPHQAGMQVMLAQQESIVQLMTLYEAVRSLSEAELVQMFGPGCGQLDQQLQAVHQEHSFGRVQMKKDRC